MFFNFSSSKIWSKYW